MAKPKLSEEEYVAKVGICCPFCGSKNTANLGQPDPGDAVIWWSSECHDCGEEWTGRYALVGFAVVE